MSKLHLSLHAMNKLVQGETASIASKTSLDNSNQVKLHVFSFQQCTSHFAARDILFV